MGQHERAEEYLRESLAIRERILAPNHPSIGTMLNNLASALEQRGEYEEAGAFYRRAVDVYRESLGERHRFTGVALCNLGHALYLTGQVDDAYTHLRDCLAILEEVHSDGHQELAHNRSRFGAVMVAQRRYEEAEPLLLRAHRALEAQLGAEHARTQQAAQRLTDLYEASG
jgi:tetratricopeptide (TPR) repeat protein